MSKQSSKPVSASSVNEHIYKVFPNDINSNDTVFGGMVLATIDRISLVVAERHSGQTCVTASVDDVHFMAPARSGDTLIFSAACNRAWGSSMEIGCRVMAENSRSGARRHIVSAYSTFVALDASDRPHPVPGIAPHGETEQLRFEEAGVRRERRLTHAGAIKALRDGKNAAPE